MTNLQEAAKQQVNQSIQTGLVLDFQTVRNTIINVGKTWIIKRCKILRDMPDY